VGNSGAAGKMIKTLSYHLTASSIERIQKPAQGICEQLQGL